MTTFRHAGRGLIHPLTTLPLGAIQQALDQALAEASALTALERFYLDADCLGVPHHVAAAALAHASADRSAPTETEIEIVRELLPTLMHLLTPGSEPQ